MMTAPDKRPSDDFREAMLALTMKHRGCDRAEAVVILNRIADRLDGYTHAEAVDRNPLPDAR